MKTDFKVCPAFLINFSKTLRIDHSFLICWAQSIAKATSSSPQMELVYSRQSEIASLYLT